MSSPTPKPNAQTEFMHSVFAEMRLVISALSESINQLSLSGIDQEKIAEMRESIFCLKLAMTYYEEANRAIQAHAWFAGSAVAAAALEAVLMSKCFFEQDNIRKLPKWRTLKKSQKEKFRTFVRTLDLGKLLEIARELHWFPIGGLPKLFEAQMKLLLEDDTFFALKGMFEGEEDIGRLCAVQVRECRNLLHPAVCLKEDREPTSDAGLAATMLFLIAFTSVADTKSGFCS